MTYQSGTIREIHRQLCENGYHVCESTIRAWTHQDVIPVAYIGRKAYITYDNVVNVLKNGTPKPPVEAESNTGIRRIEK